MSHPGLTSATRQRPSSIDGAILVSNLVAGAILLAVLAFLSWTLAVIGAAYVAAASVFLAAIYMRPALARWQEVAAWLAPWLAAAALWTVVLAGGDGGRSTWPVTAWVGLVVATPCYVAWQVLALAVRQLSAWRARLASS